MYIVVIILFKSGGVRVVFGKVIVVIIKLLLWVFVKRCGVLFLGWCNVMAVIGPTVIWFYLFVGRWC